MNVLETIQQTIVPVYESLARADIQFNPLWVILTPSELEEVRAQFEFSGTRPSDHEIGEWETHPLKGRHEFKCVGCYYNVFLYIRRPEIDMAQNLDC